MSSPPGGASRASRAVAGLALAGVSVIAGGVSYLHGLAVAQSVGARPPVAWLIPFLADLVILGASAALIGQRGARPVLAIVALAAGSRAARGGQLAAGGGKG